MLTNALKGLARVAWMIVALAIVVVPAWAASTKQVALLSGAKATLRQIATRTLVPNFGNTSNHQMMSRRGAKASVNISSLQIVIPNWYVAAQSGTAQTGVETAAGGSATVTASIEYPANTFKQVTFQGSSSGSIPSGGNITSDVVGISIPKGSIFYVRIFFVNSTAIIYSNSNGYGTYPVANSYYGDVINAAASGLSDQTMGGTISSVTTNATFGPTAIIAKTTAQSLCLIGDSRVFGYNDNPDSSGDVGSVARSVGGNYAYINMGVGSDRIAWWVASHTNRLALTSYCSRVVVELGINDLHDAGYTAAQTLSAQQTLYALMPNLPKWQTTLEPESTSSDGWATPTSPSGNPGDQATSSINAARVAVNTAIRSVPAQLRGFLEVANQIESGVNTGIWQAPGFTIDGIHEVQKGYLAIQSSGVINPLAFH